MKEGKELPKKINDWADYGYSEEDWKSLDKTIRYKIRHPQRCKDFQKNYRESHKEGSYLRSRKSQLKLKYNLTIEEYDELLESQEFKCAICLTDKPTGKWKQFAVDHCHQTGKVRGLLCNDCNRGMGLLRDNSNLLRKAAEYLDNHKSITKNENKERNNE